MQTDNAPRTLTRREALLARHRKRPTRITVPQNVSPHVRLVFEEMGRQRRTYDEIEDMSGVLRNTLKAWRHKNKPGIDSLCAVFGVLGWDFVPIPRAKVLPQTLVADLDAVAAKHGLATSPTVEALFLHVARFRERLFEAPPTAPDLADTTRGIAGTDTAAA